MINHELQLKKGVSYLKQLREAVDISQESFARKMGVSTKTVYRWEAGVYSVNFSGSQWKVFCKEVLFPLGIDVLDIPDDLGAPYVEIA